MSPSGLKRTCPNLRSLAGSSRTRFERSCIPSHANTLKFTAALARMPNPNRDPLTGRGERESAFHSHRSSSPIRSEDRPFLVSTQAPEHSGISSDDQQRRVGLPMITSMKTEFFFGFLIGLVTGVLLCVGVMLLIEPIRFH